jgi:hypothetical protein
MILLIGEDQRDAGPTGMKLITQNNRYCFGGIHFTNHAKAQAL